MKIYRYICMYLRDYEMVARDGIGTISRVTKDIYTSVTFRLTAHSDARCSFIRGYKRRHTSINSNISCGRF